MKSNSEIIGIVVLYKGKMSPVYPDVVKIVLQIAQQNANALLLQTQQGSGKRRLGIWVKLGQS